MPSPSAGPYHMSKRILGQRSTSLAGRAVIAAAIRGAKTADSARYADACAKEKNWRFQYQKHFMNMVKVSAERSVVPG